MITEQEIRNQAVKVSDSRLDGHDVSAFVRGAVWALKQLKLEYLIKRTEQACTKQDCCCVHRQNDRCGLHKCIY